MSFDASKLIPGKEYKTRDGGLAEYVRDYQSSHWGTCLLWLWVHADLSRMPYSTTTWGIHDVLDLTEGEMDIVSDEPAEIEVTPI